VNKKIKNTIFLKHYFQLDSNNITYSGGSLFSLIKLFLCANKGKNGDIIRGLARTTSVKIDVDRSDVKRQNGLKLVTLKGSESGIRMAKVCLISFAYHIWELSLTATWLMIKQTDIHI
jgi:hypothetical protein